MTDRGPESVHMYSNGEGERPSGKDKLESGPVSATSADGTKPVDLKGADLVDAGLPPEIWTIVQSVPAKFTPLYFLDVSRNLLENPNLTASHLSRAELSYTSFTDVTYNPDAKHPHELAGMIKHMKLDHQPRIIPGGFPGYKLEWTVVRKLIPRNPKLDQPMLQTCHLFTSTGTVAVQSPKGVIRTIEAERYLIIYLPHVSNPESIPFYHPKVRGVAILYTFQINAPSDAAPGTLSIYYDLFPERPLEERMSRTALKMLEIIHKHSRGRMQGYQKRVHHDVVIPQKAFQDTYVYLKGKYAKELIDGWVEQTPAQKHVFEDLGIAAFLIELWTDMYGGDEQAEPPNITNESVEHPGSGLNSPGDLRRKRAQDEFPGFVDIGCGNGVLVYLLNREGWIGWGFDARRRKTWDTFPEEYQKNLQDMLLVPKVLHMDGEEEDQTMGGPVSHDGMFPSGTFIISNHADELTVWTPILAFLSDSPFIAIPCCSHNFGGTRFRAPHHPKHLSQPAGTGKQQSAFATLCSYVAYVTETMGYMPEKEHLRIPSTRNIAIIGRTKKPVGAPDEDPSRKLDFARGVIENEMGGDTSIEQVRLQWLKRGSGLLKPGKNGH